jgi:hypothetical protein
MAIFPDKNDPIIRELREIRKRHAVLEEADPEAWAERLRQAGKLTKGKLVSFVKGSPDYVGDDYRYADLCGPASTRTDLIWEEPTEPEEM